MLPKFSTVQTRKRTGTAGPSMPPTALLPLAEMLGVLSEHFQDQATKARKDEIRIAQIRSRVAAIDETAKVLATYLADGRTLDQAVAMTAQISGLDEAAMSEVTRRAIRFARDRIRDRRNRWIMQKAALGWTDREIGDALSPPLHEKSVNRIIAGERRKARRLGQAA